MRTINPVPKPRTWPLVACGVVFSTHLHAGPNDWAMYNKTYDGNRFSSLTQINGRNAASLKEICRIQVAKAGSFHTGLVVVDNRMYLTNAHWTFAIDAVDLES
jgi:alcohol dehydrogenase (cytochrome c)